MRATGTRWLRVTGMVILSGYDSPMYREIYADWRVAARRTIGEKTAKRTECLWISPNASVAMPQQSLLETL